MAELVVMKGVKFTEKRLLEWFKEDGKVVVQTKRDEIRCRVRILHTEVPGGTEVTYTSAQGKPLYNLGCFDDFWIDFSQRTGRRDIDTGVCVENSFDLTKRTVRASKKPYNLNSGEIHTIVDKKTGFYFSGTLQAHFWLYDIVDHYGTYEDRRRYMADLCQMFQPISCPETWVIEKWNQEQVEDAVQQVYEINENLVALGHEGTMVKRFYHSWYEGRTTDWMKLKPCEERDGEITGYVAGKGKYEGLIGSVNLRFVDGSTTSVSGMSDALRTDISERPEEYLGRIVEMRYMQRDSQGGYRHPVFYRFHPDKETLEGSE